MIFKIKKHSTDLYNTLLFLSRDLFFYNKVKLKDSYETRIYLMFMFFSIILQVFRQKKVKFLQKEYDNLFFCIENNLRELGFGDVAVNKKMKYLNKILYDILLKINNTKDGFRMNKSLILKYFTEIDNLDKKYRVFDEYFNKFYHFCFEQNTKTMIKDAIKFKDQ